MPSFTTRDGAEIDYSDSGGSGRALVMLPGWGQTQAMFKHQLAGWAGSSWWISPLRSRRSPG